MRLCKPLDFASHYTHLHKVREDEVNRTFFHRWESRLEKDNLEDLVLGGMIILKRVLHKEDLNVLLFHVPFINYIQMYKYEGESQSKCKIHLTALIEAFVGW